MGPDNLRLDKCRPQRRMPVNERRKSCMRSQSYRYTTLDLVVMAVIGVVFAILNNFMGVFYQTFTATVGPVFASVFAVFGIAPCLAMFIIRKPGAAIITFVLNSVVQALAGNPAG